jgi:protein tyrosine phosphatase (PTP) superfamily phosphohydrolase (DUF442 family)
MLASRLFGRRLAVTLFVLPLVSLALIIGHVCLVQKNFRIASPDLFRSGQLSDSDWQRTFDQTHYRSVLNLQGAKPDTSWYQTEIQFASDHGIEHFDYGLSAHVSPTIDQMREIVALMRRAPKPLLIHCKNGADRSGLVAALYLFAVDHRPADVAGGQLSMWYGHFPYYDGRSRAMDTALANFVTSETSVAAADLSSTGSAAAVQDATAWTAWP